MVHSQHYPLFFYGTLRSKEVRYAVLNRLESSLNLVTGFIIGYDLFLQRREPGRGSGEVLEETGAILNSLSKKLIPKCY